MKVTDFELDETVFKTIYPTGSKLKADVYTGLQEVTVISGPEKLGDGTVVFKANYGTVSNALICTSWVRPCVADVLRYAATTYPIGTRVFGETLSGQYAEEVTGLPVEEGGVVMMLLETGYKPLSTVRGVLPGLERGEDTNE
jgi:hypothetical protein